MRHYTVALAAAFLALSAYAEDPVSPKAPEFTTKTSGISVGAGFGTGTYGEQIPGHVALELDGVKSWDGRKYVLTWNAQAGATGGYAGNQHPGFFFAGGYLKGNGELGYRLTPESNWSPYMSGGADAAFSGVAALGTPLDKYDTINNLDGLAGVNGAFSLRYSLGASYLNPKHALTLTAFVQEALRAPGSFSDSTLYNEVGLHGQYDYKNSFSIVMEALYGTSLLDTHDSAFGSTTEKERFEAVMSVRKLFGKGWWVALDTKVSEEGAKTVYSGSPVTYTTNGPLSPYVGLSLGIPIELGVPAK
ncbi:MAG: hypothetical protein HY075_02380 [Deltaproteobacteria bacterium]|nr:hypothetical protein [Deltaproteobacteria bacterium]